MNLEIVRQCDRIFGYPYKIRSLRKIVRSEIIFRNLRHIIFGGFCELRKFPDENV